MEAALIKEDKIIYLKGAINFKTARVVYLQSQSLMATEPEWRIDFSAVTSFNSAMLSLMIEWIRMAQQTTTKLSFQAVPNAVISMANVAGLTALFKCYGLD